MQNRGRVAAFLGSFLRIGKLAPLVEKIKLSARANTLVCLRNCLLESSVERAVSFLKIVINAIELRHSKV
jgi:hypothetical protein